MLGRLQPTYRSFHMPILAGRQWDPVDVFGSLGAVVFNASHRCADWHDGTEKKPRLLVDGINARIVHFARLSVRIEAAKNKEGMAKQITAPATKIDKVPWCRMNFAIGRPELRTAFVGRFGCAPRRTDNDNG